MNDAPSGSLLDRTVANLRSAWRDIALRGRSSDRVLAGPDLPDDDVERLRRHITECLENRGGEVSARARAALLGRDYLNLAPAGRRRFLEVLGRDFGVDRARLDGAVANYIAARDGGAPLHDAESALRVALLSPRVRLLSQLTALPDGFKFLVDLRAELLGHLGGDPSLVELDRDLQRLFLSWFDVGFLTLERIGWDAPAALLEKLIAYEAVHEIRSWQDLKNRLDSDRRCYAFFHPRMPGEPLIFVEVALVNGIAGSIQELLDEHAPRSDPRQADTAIFYSISNTQIGLRGISFGNFLIKKVVDDLSKHLPRLRNFATLSPIPGFRGWLDQRLADGEPRLLTAAERERLKTVAPDHGAKGGLKHLLATSGWPQDPAMAGALETPLKRLCARYLVAEKGSDGRPLDAVARFHLMNGARIERINWLGDNSAKGMAQSAGLMVNYLYRLADIEGNHEAFASRGRVAASSAVKALLG